MRVSETPGWAAEQMVSSAAPCRVSSHAGAHNRAVSGHLVFLEVTHKVACISLLTLALQLSARFVRLLTF